MSMSMSMQLCIFHTLYISAIVYISVFVYFCNFVHFCNSEKQYRTITGITLFLRPFLNILMSFLNLFIKSILVLLHNYAETHSDQCNRYQRIGKGVLTSVHTHGFSLNFAY